MKNMARSANYALLGIDEADNMMSRIDKAVKFNISYQRVLKRFFKNRETQEIS